LNERQIKAVKYVRGKGKITNKEYQELNGVSNKTAYWELSQITEKSVLQSEGRGKNTSYVIFKR
jgi:ATP-dependent DNA helicase RecG